MESCLHSYYKRNIAIRYPVPSVSNLIVQDPSAIPYIV